MPANYSPVKAMECFSCHEKAVYDTFYSDGRFAFRTCEKHLEFTLQTINEIEKNSYANRT